MNEVEQCVALEFMNETEEGGNVRALERIYLSQSKTSKSQDRSFILYSKSDRERGHPSFPLSCPPRIGNLEQ